MTRYRATLAYDGTHYHGFQKQANAPTIQGEVERHLTAILGQPVTVMGAGRTDTGVHATGQVIAFDADWAHGERALLTIVNNALPEDIALRDLVAHEGFRPRYNALSRAYQYAVVICPTRQPLLRTTAWHVAHPLDVAQMNAAAALLTGRHDFATFGKPPQGTNTLREVFRSEWTQEPADTCTRLTYHIEATAFLYHMVRRIVWLLVEVGRGALSVERFESAFRQARLRGAVKLAPPQGLVLVAVRYNDA